jgi:cysteine desulfurase / selenocysteine lyase
VTALPKCVADAMTAHVDASCRNHQEFGEVLRDIARSRETCARLIGADSREIALLGPTSLGLSLFANGLDWKDGDELVCYQDDYPSNVYPWAALSRHGVVVRYLKPEAPGQITPELVSAALTPRTRLVALASCHFLTGWRIDVDAIGRMLHEKGILFSVDGIQTLGAFPFSVEHVDFLSADAHKWMLGPLAIGIVYVKKEHFPICRPTLLGSWNVRSPNFVAQDAIEFPESAQRYEPGVLNVTGMYGMKAGLDMALEVGIERISQSILEVRDYLYGRLADLGFETASPTPDNPMRSGILTVRHPSLANSALFSALEKAKITASLRMGRDNTEWLRFSPHFYNTKAEMDRVVEVLAGQVS